MEGFENYKHCWYITIHFCLKTSDGQSLNLYFNFVYFFNDRLYWTTGTLKTVIFLHGYLTRAVLLSLATSDINHKSLIDKVNINLKIVHGFKP